MSQADDLKTLLADPELSGDLLEKLDCEASLLDFFVAGWESIEPGTPLVHGFPLEAICEHLEAVTRGEIRRLLINVPPGFSKSLSTNVFWPMWEWGPMAMPHLRYISAAYDKQLSTRDNVRSRDLALSEWYQGHWGDVWNVKGDQNAKERYENDKSGWRQASSTGSGLTGHRGDRLVLDDPHAVKDSESSAKREEALRWFSETLPTRLNDQAKSAIVVIMQRVHERDVSGLILKSELGYEHLCLPMEYEPRHRCFTTVPRAGVQPVKVQRLKRENEPLPVWLDEDGMAYGPDRGAELRPELEDKPLGPDDTLGPPELRYLWDVRTEDMELLWAERFPRIAVEELKAVFRSWGGTYAEAGQLQQRPAPRGGGMFQEEDFQYLDEAPANVQWVSGWDLAGSKGKKSPWTARCKMGIDSRNRVIIAHVRRKKATPGEVETMLLETARMDGHGVVQDLPQDPGQAGKAQKRTLISLLQGYTAYASPESGSKPDRAVPLAAQSEAGNVWLVRGPWNDAFVSEACLFPNADFSDQIDAASRAHARCVMMRGTRRGVAAPIVIGG